MNAVIAEKDNNDGIQLAVPGLGERLRSARLAQDMDMEKLAARIHLTVDTVDALEHDDYSEMPARVFVRGYVRNYARTVDLPVESVLAQFDRQWVDEEAPVKVRQSPRLASDTNPGNSWPSLVTWLLVLVLLVLFLVWWQGYLDHFIEQWRKPQTADTTEQAADAPPAAEAVGAPGLQIPALKQSAGPTGEIALPTGGGALPLPSPAPSANEAAPAAEAAPEPTGSDADAVEAAAASPVAEQTVSQLEPVPPSAPVQAKAPQAAVPAGTAVNELAMATPAAQPQPVVAGVSVRFLGDCWVDIRDRTRTFKLFGTKKRGSELELGGKPPYKVVLGNAHGVQIRVDGKPFDLSPYIEGNVARFTLNP